MSRTLPIRFARALLVGNGDSAFDDGRGAASARATPHLGIDRRGLYDRTGPEFTLLRFDPAADAAPLGALLGRKLPLELLDVTMRRSLPARLVWSWPADQYVDWRDDGALADPWP